MKEIKSYIKNFQFEFDYSYHIDRIIKKFGYWEPHVLTYIFQQVKPGMVAVDVGANAGYQTIIMADRVGSAGKVYAFEPNPDTRLRLIRNLELNPELLSRVVVSEKGVGNKSDIFYLSIDDRPEAFGNAGLIENSSNPEHLKVEVVTLDEFIPEEISFIKIDVEGMELEVLQGAIQKIKDNHPIIVFETLTTEPPETHKPIEDFLRQFDYKIYCYDQKGEYLMETGYPYYPAEDCMAIYMGKN